MINADKRFMFCFSYLDLLSVEFTPVSLVPTFPSFPFFPHLFPTVKKAISLPTPGHCVNWKVCGFSRSDAS